MNDEVKKAEDTLNVKSIFLPIVLGLISFFFLLVRDKNITLNNLLLIRNIKIEYLILSILLIFIRDFLYIVRIRLLVGKSISYLNCFIIIALWEFASAVTPSAVGGGFVAVLLFLHEGIPLGSAIAYVMVTATFDNYFFLLLSPVGYLFSGLQAFSISLIYFVSYVLIFVYSTIMTCSVFIKPEIFRFIIVNVTRIKFLRRFREGGLKSAQEIVNSSKILKRYGLKFWCLILLITLAAWISRYLILNSLIAGFIDFPLSQHFEILCKHLVLWVTMLVSPTPGGVGFVEYFFNDFYASTLKDYTIIVTMIWRLLTFYLYLFIGVIILPGWIKTFKNRKLKNKADNSDISQ